MKKSVLFILFIYLFISCSEKKPTELAEGIWRGTMEVQEGNDLPFNFNLKKSGTGLIMEVMNASEVLLIDEISITNDSILIRMPVFEGYVAATFTENSIEGNFIKESLDRVVPFRAQHGDSTRFYVKQPAALDISGIWEAEFSKDTEDAYIAKGIFSQKGEHVTGTIRTTTGDYRYLEGVVDGDSLKLSTFDGAHVFLFLAKLSEEGMQGVFYSGNHFQEPFEAKPNPDYELPDANTLTYLKEGYDKVSFSFPDAQGNMVSLEDDEYQGKVVVLQIMGTWCPNCLDETKFLVEYLKENANKDLKILALSFEYAKTKEAAFKGITRLKERLGISYPILLAQFGTSNKQTANEKLPMLNHILSYPTTIFIDKKGVVRKIHTGFNGPATGDKYLEFKEEFKTFIQTLITE